MKRYLFIISLGLGCFGLLSAQSLKGKVINEAGNPIEGVTVVLQKADSTFIDVSLTDTIGRFRFKQEEMPCRLIFQHVAYETRKVEKAAFPDTPISIGSQRRKTWRTTGCRKTIRTIPGVKLHADFLHRFSISPIITSRFGPGGFSGFGPHCIVESLSLPTGIPTTCCWIRNGFACRFLPGFCGVSLSSSRNRLPFWPFMRHRQSSAPASPNSRRKRLTPIRPHCSD